MNEIKKKYALGVDVGGSHISSTTYDIIEHKLVDGTSRSLQIDSNGSKEKIINCFAELIKPEIESIRPEELAGVGIAMPGPIDYEHGIGLFAGDNQKYANLYKVNIREELSEALKVDKEQIRFINDATAFAVGEHVNGELYTVKRGLAITLGTGFGAAFLNNGIPVLNDDRIPSGGYLWDQPFAESIADDYFSTRGIVNRFNVLSDKKVQGVKEIADLYDKNEIAKNVFFEYGNKLATFLAPWLKSFEVDKLVIGGNISRAFLLFEASLCESISRAGLKVIVKPSKKLEDSAFLGASLLLNNSFYESIKNELKYM